MKHQILKKSVSAQSIFLIGKSQLIIILIAMFHACHIVLITSSVADFRGESLLLHIEVS